ncbi:MAG: transglycosylase domain-containing protein [Saprospiraceae bacterium]
MQPFFQREFWVAKGEALRNYSYQKAVQLRDWYRVQNKPRLFLKIFGILSLTGILLVVSFIAAIYFGGFGKLPTEEELAVVETNSAAEIYTVDSLLIGKYFVENRINAEFSEISPDIINALVATEDARFFEHKGVDVRATLRVLFRSIILGDESGGGGSTLSQQLAKNLFGRKRHGILTLPVNKFKEIFTARRLESVYSKEQLLNLYLNTVPFSENVFGVKVAAQRFFNTSPKDVTVEQAAVLVGMLKATTTYNPVRRPERALERRNVVMAQMVKYNYLDSLAFDSLKVLPIELDYRRESNNTGIATYFREHLRLELSEVLTDFKKPNGESYNLYTDGLKIYSTIDSRLQLHAEDAVSERMKSLQKKFFQHWKTGVPWGNDDILQSAIQRSSRYRKLKERGKSEEQIQKTFAQPIQMTIFDWEKGSVEKEMTPLDSVKYDLMLLHAGFLAMNPQTGAVKAWVGGIDHKFYQYDHVKSQRQVGSTFKPLVYAQALEQGMQPCEYIHNRLVTYTEFEDWKPRNANGRYEGVYSMEGGLARSVNAVTVDVMVRTGAENVAALAENMGVTGEVPAVPAISLGTVNTSLYDMVQVYGTFANRGVRPEMHYLSHITNAEGDTLFIYTPPQSEELERVLSEPTADIMIEMMETVVDSGTARRLRYEYGLNNDIAGKTGTTQNHSDGWFIGYTPNLVFGAWVGAESPAVRFRTLELGGGSATALPICGTFLQKTYRDPDFKNLKRATFPPLPDSLTWKIDCPLYLPEMPYAAEWGEEYSDEEVEGFFDDLIGVFRKKSEQEKKLERQRKERQLAESKQSREVRERNKKLEQKRNRQKKRKKFWDRVLKREQ